MKNFDFKWLESKTKAKYHIIKDLLHVNDCALNAGAEEDLQNSEDSEEIKFALNS